MAKKDALTLRFVIPAYNEEGNIVKLLTNLKYFVQQHGYNYQVIVINDGSTDGTLKILREQSRHMSLVVIDQPRNMGVGAAFRAGFKYAVENCAENDIIVTKEADNTSDMRILEPMIEKVRSGSDLVLASCYMPGGRIKGTSLYRRVLSTGANFLLKLFTPLKGVNTFSSFYRAYSARLLKKAHNVYGDTLIEEGGFVCMVELLLKLALLDIKIAEVPMVLRGNLRVGKSKMKTFRTMLSYIKLISNCRKIKNDLKKDKVLLGREEASL